MGLRVELEYQTSYYNIRRPDYSFVLTVDDEDLRQHRISSRGILSASDEAANNPVLRANILTEYCRYASEFTLIDNGDREISKVVSDIRSVIFGSDGGTV